MREKSYKKFNQLNVSRNMDLKDGRCEGSGFPVCQNGHQKAFLPYENSRKLEQLPDSIKTEVRAGNIQAETEAIESLAGKDRVGDSNSDSETGLDIKMAKRYQNM
jgi:hypothetical protein